MKKCIFCGKELADEATWCPYCEKEQLQPEEVKMPIVRRKRVVIGCLIAALLIGAGIFIAYRFLKPKVYKGGASIEYTLDGKPCTIFLTFRPDGRRSGQSQDSTTISLPKLESAAQPSQLVAYSIDNPGIQDVFIENVLSCSVTTEPLDGAEKMNTFGPKTGESAGFEAAWVTDVNFWPECGTNYIHWEVKMKNGDTLLLSQTLTCKEQPVVEYRYTDTPMETVSQIQELIKKTAEEAPDAILTLYLPPITYDEKLTIADRTAFLYGSTDEDGHRTTFAETVEVSATGPYMTKIFEVDFQGKDKTGEGIISRDALVLQACLVTGWDVGIDSLNGSWVSMNNCALVGNNIGFRFNSQQAASKNPFYENIVFAENGLGLQVLSVPDDFEIEFANPTFDANEKDIEDPKGLVHLS